MEANEERTPDDQPGPRGSPWLGSDPNAGQSFRPRAAIDLTIDQISKVRCESLTSALNVLGTTPAHARGALIEAQGQLDHALSLALGVALHQLRLALDAETADAEQ